MHAASKRPPVSWFGLDADEFAYLRSTLFVIEFSQPEMGQGQTEAILRASRGI